MWLVLLLVPSIGCSGAVRVMFESFEQLDGFDLAIYNLRVRKLNRTTTALNGTVDVIDWLSNDMRFTMDLFHSRLGNQQFNHYPMKLPSAGTCEYFDNMQISYSQFLTGVENMPAIGECPISPRVIVIKDFVFPSEVVPRVAPRGLWKALMTGRSASQNLTYFLLAKFYDEY